MLDITRPISLVEEQYLTIVASNRKFFLGIHINQLFLATNMIELALEYIG